MDIQLVGRLVRGTGRVSGFWHDSRTCRRLIAAIPKSDDSINLIQCFIKGAKKGILRSRMGAGCRGKDSMMQNMYRFYLHAVPMESVGAAPESRD